MRLTDQEVAAIKQAALEAFGAAATVRLFGSRLDDSRRGGDIDLHVMLDEDASVEARGRFRMLLERFVGEREYDIVVASARGASSSIDQKAVAEGQVL